MTSSAYAFQLSSRPLAIDGLTIEEIGDETVVSHVPRREYHLLNLTANAVLKACNGVTSVSQIVAGLKLQYMQFDADTILDDVLTVLSEFREKNLIYEVVDTRALDGTAIHRDGEDQQRLLAAYIRDSGMFPLIVAGDSVLLRPAGVGDLETGDIIAFSNERMQCVARRIALHNAGPESAVMTPNGDVYIEDDPPIVPSDRVLGEVIGVLRETGVQWFRHSDEPSTTTGTEKDVAAIGASTVFKSTRVLDFRDLSPDAIRSIESVEDPHIVLLSPRNAHAWVHVRVSGTATVVEVPDTYRVFTGQPELTPEALALMSAPIGIVVVGQLFLTECDAEQIVNIKELILFGQAYVHSPDAKLRLEAVIRPGSGPVLVVPRVHTRWMGDSVLGPEYLSAQHLRPLVAVGALQTSQRIADTTDLPLFRGGFHSDTQAQHGTH